MIVMATKNYTVEGMSCGHCEMSIREEVGEIAGVEAVSADHTTGAVSGSGRGLPEAGSTYAAAGAAHSSTSAPVRVVARVGIRGHLQAALLRGRGKRFMGHSV